MELERLKNWIEGALLAAGQPLSLNQLNSLFDEDDQPGHGPIREALALLDSELEGRACELVEVAGGFRLQIRASLMPVVSRLWAEKPPRYSRALLETLAIIAYRQPITRGEIEQIRGVSLSANILKTLQEREWIRVVGHRDIPGRPELLGTSRSFLDYFGLKGLDDLPTLAEIRDLDNLEPELDFNLRGSNKESDHEQADPHSEDRDPQDPQHEHAAEDSNGSDRQDEQAGRQHDQDDAQQQPDQQQRDQEPRGKGQPDQEQPVGDEQQTDAEQPGTREDEGPH
jgi:segregation and condensation protein B